MWASEADPLAPGLSTTLLWRGIRIDPTLAASLLMSSGGAASAPWRYDSSCPPALFRFFLPCYGIPSDTHSHVVRPSPLLPGSYWSIMSIQREGRRREGPEEAMFASGFPASSARKAKEIGYRTRSSRSPSMREPSHYLVLSMRPISCVKAYRKGVRRSLIDLTPLGATFVGFLTSTPIVPRAASRW